MGPGISWLTCRAEFAGDCGVSQDVVGFLGGSDAMRTDGTHRGCEEIERAPGARANHFWRPAARRDARIVLRSRCGVVTPRGQRSLLARNSYAHRSSVMSSLDLKPTLVMGARGSVGAHVLAELLAHARPVRASARRPEPGQFPVGLYVRADLTEIFGGYAATA